MQYRPHNPSENILLTVAKSLKRDQTLSSFTLHPSSSSPHRRRLTQDLWCVKSRQFLCWQKSRASTSPKMRLRSFFRGFGSLVKMVILLRSLRAGVSFGVQLVA
ncbi:hypothetical protein Droror1_Dr00011318 [Drosera rotundifolia]